MSGAPVSQYPLPPLFYAVTAQPPALPADGADLKTFGGTVPYTPLAPDVKESNYGDQLRSQIKGLITAAVQLVGNAPHSDADIQRCMTDVDSKLSQIFEIIENHKHHEAKSTLKSLLIKHLARAKEVEANLQRAVDEAEAELAEL